MPAVFSRGTVDHVHDHRTEKTGQGKPDEHDTVIDTVVPASELSGRISRIDAHNAAEAESND